MVLCTTFPISEHCTEPVVLRHDDVHHDDDADDQEEVEEEEETIPSPLKQILDGVGKSKPEVTITPTLKTTTIMSPEDYKQVLPN